MITFHPSKIHWHTRYGLLGVFLIGFAAIGFYTDASVGIESNMLTVGQMLGLRLLAAISGLLLIRLAFIHAPRVVDVPISELEFKNFQYSLGLWSSATFPKSTDTGRLKHLLEEIAELEADPTDEAEIADVLLILMHQAHVHHVDLWAASYRFKPDSTVKVRLNPILQMRSATLDLLARPSDPALMAKIAHAGMAHARAYGIDWWKAAHAKYAQIQTRTWHPPDAEGIVRHVKLSKAA